MKLSIIIFPFILACFNKDIDPRILNGALTIDRNFSQDQIVDIEEAINIWTEATSGRFNPSIIIGDVNCEDAFAIKAVATEGCHVGQLVEDNLRVLGATDADEHWVSVVTWLEGDAFLNNVAHELGHYMYLSHGGGIMAQSKHNQPNVITIETKNEFCSIWGCERNSS